MAKHIQSTVVAATLAAAAPGQVLAQDAGEGGAIVLDPVIVTGELIDRPLAETGTSAEVLNQEALEKRAGIDSVRDVIDQTVNVSGLTGSIFAPTIRGVDGTGPAIGGNAFFGGTRPRLNWLIDGRPAGFNEVIYGDFQVWDLDRVEILRGPQSTLAGRNSSAGTVVVETNDPSFDLETAVQFGAGNFDQRRSSVMINAPVDDQIAFRLTADYRSSESHIEYQPFPGVDDPAEREALNLRGKLLLLPDIGKDTELLLTVSHHKNEGPASERVVRPFGDRISTFPLQPVHTLTTNSIGAEFQTAFTNDLRFELGATYSDFAFDREATPQGGPATIDNKEWVIEPRLVYEDAAGYSAVAGLHYYRSRQDEYILFAFDNNFRDETDTIGAYAEGVIPLSDQFDLTLGLRYEHESRRRVGGDAGTLVDIDLDETYDAFLPKAGVTWSPNENMSFGVLVSRGFNAGGAGVTFPFPSFFPVVSYTFGSEHVWNYEVFGRQEFADGRVRTTQNIFFSDYRDMQLQSDVTPANTLDGAFVVENFDKVRTYGAELGAEALVTEGLTVFGNLGLLWTDIVDAPNARVEGNELPTAPNVTASLGAVWEHHGWRASVSGRYSGSYFSDIENRAGSKVSDFFTADAELGYDFGGVEVFGSVKNVFDSDSAIALFPSTTPGVPDQGVLQQPRTFFMGLKATF